MLSASRQGARAPLSPLTQTTLEKHLPGLPTKRLFQQNKVMTVDIGCVTGSFRNPQNILIFRCPSISIGRGAGYE